ncbi:MAG: DUF480 domain-containing protein [Desulfatiglans sp.]|nr:DUF480 domain-containing protein [Desulfatiglans sp.]
MDILLTNEEIRVLGCLMEKEMATPEYYPLSINALINACNQKSNRDPVTSYSEGMVASALEGLRKKKLAMESSGSRVARYAQTFSNEYTLKRSEGAVMCILFVRGPQTMGEIRSRTDRLYPFASLEEVQVTISNLERVGLVIKLERQPGRKEHRYAHLLAGEQDIETHEDITQLDAAQKSPDDEDNLNLLKDEITMLREELSDLKKEFEAFKAQFG